MPLAVRRLAWLGTLLASVGVAISAYLSYEHGRGGTTLACPETGIVNCAKVTESSYASIAGVSVAYLGLGFFVVMTVLSLPWAWARSERWIHAARAALAGSGVLMVLWLIYAELFGLDAICLWCTAVHVIAVALGAVVAYATALRGEPV